MMTWVESDSEEYPVGRLSDRPILFAQIGSPSTSVCGSKPKYCGM